MCKARRRADDDLSLVAGASSRQRRALKARGVPTRRGLAGLELPMAPALEGVGDAGARAGPRAGPDPGGVGGPGRGRCGSCCRSTATPTARPVPDRGLLVLPEPSARATCSSTSRATRSRSTTASTTCSGSWSRGCPRTAGGPRPAATRCPGSTRSGASTTTGASPGPAEKAAFERTIDLIMDRWARDPAMHVYHYAAYERTALGRLAQRHGTREEEVDRLLRGRVLVDLFRVGPAGHPGGRRELLDQADRAAVRARARGRRSRTRAAASWRSRRGWSSAPRRPVEDARADPGRDRGLQPRRRREQLAAARLARGPPPRPRGPGGRALAATGPRRRAARARPLTERERGGQPARGLADRRRSGRSRGPRAAEPEVAGRWLLAQLLAWHRREDKSAWWRYFELLGKTDDELIDEREPLGGLELIDSWPVKHSTVLPLLVPAAGPPDRRQQQDRRPADAAVGRARSSRSTTSRCTITIRRGPMLAGVDAAAVPRSRGRRAERRPRGEPPADRRSGSPPTGSARSTRMTPAAAGIGRGPRPAAAARRRTPAGPGRAAAARRARRRSRPRSGSCRARGSGMLPIQGPPGLGQDVHRRADDRRPRRGRASASASSPTATRSSARCSTRWPTRRRRG